MLRASFFASIRTLSSLAALLSATAGVAALAGCGPIRDGGPCAYALVGTATYTVLTITPGSTSTPSGEQCSTVDFGWVSGAKDVVPPAPFLATEACLAAAGVQVGSSVSWTLEDETSGTCDPQSWTSSPSLIACDMDCT